MANTDSDPKVTKRQAENVRARIAKHASDLAERLRKNSMGELDSEMTPSQVKSAQILLDRVLPTMQSIDQTTHNDTPELTPAEIDAMLREYMKQLPPDELAQLLQPQTTHQAPELTQ